jgi:hypothetical protein
MQPPRPPWYVTGDPARDRAYALSRRTSRRHRVRFSALLAMLKKG